MKVADIGVLPQFYDRYIGLVGEELEINEAFSRFSVQEVYGKDSNILLELGDKVYTSGKWTVKQILQHCIDTERIMAYRALCFARGEAKSLPSFDENDYADAADVENKTVEGLLEEFSVLRKSTVFFFSSLSDDVLLRRGTASNIEISVLALACVILGHAIHHKNVLEERYYPIV